jgi:hypothetical protein
VKVTNTCRVAFEHVLVASTRSLWLLSYSARMIVTVSAPPAAMVKVAVRDVPFLNLALYLFALLNSEKTDPRGLVGWRIWADTYEVWRRAVGKLWQRMFAETVRLRPKAVQNLCQPGFDRM